MPSSSPLRLLAHSIASLSHSARNCGSLNVAANAAASAAARSGGMPGGAVNGRPGGRRLQGSKERHRPEPREHPGILVVGDYLLQTEWQAQNKRGGLGPDPVARRALASHVAVYTLAYVPALIWIGLDLSLATAIGIAALIAVPHFVQDDGRLVLAYMARVKHTRTDLHSPLFRSVDQSFHLLALFGGALLLTA